MFIKEDNNFITQYNKERESSLSIDMFSDTTAWDRLLSTHYSNYDFKTVVDVGASGDTSIQYAKKFNPRVVYSFEPSDMARKSLINRIPPALSTMIKVLPEAVCEDNSTGQDFYIFTKRPDGSSNSLNKIIRDDSRWGKPTTITVPTTRLDTFLSTQKVDKLDILDSDTQGHDYEVLLSAGDFLTTVEIVHTEVWFTPPANVNTKNGHPAYENVQTFDKIMSLLRSNGLELYSFTSLSYHGGEILWGNALFYRR